MISLLHRAQLRYLLRHPWQTGLAILGIGLAVAVVVGIDLANTSADRAFRLGVEGLTGRATHEIVGGTSGLDDAVYTRLRRIGVSASAPIIEAYVTAPDFPRRTFRLLGIDPLAEDSFRSFTSQVGAGGSSGDLTSFFTIAGAAALGRPLAEELGLEIDSTLRLRAAGRDHLLKVVALLEPQDDLDRQATRDLLVVDISTAQEWLDFDSRLSRIDLVLPETAAGEAQLETVRDLLPLEVELMSKEARGGTLAQMTRAFRLNLSALGLLALLVGMFLIYNAMTFSVVQRRALFGALRAIGVTRREILRDILSEAALVGLVGTALGLALGYGLATGLLGLVVRTINDFYFVLSVSSVTLTPLSLAKSLALGVGGTVLAALRPAYEATSAPPRASLSRSDLESRSHRLLPRTSLIGALLILGAAALLLVSKKNLPLSFGAIFAGILGVACLVPGATVLLGRAFRPPVRHVLGILGSLAVRGVEATLSRTGVAIAALTVAVAMTIGVSTMVSSFRLTLIDWLEVTLQADLYLTSAQAGTRDASAALEPMMIEALAQQPGVDFLTSYRGIRVRSPLGQVQLAAVRTQAEAFKGYRFVDREPEDVWPLFEQGQVVISEPFAFRHDLEPGDAIELTTDRGPRSFEIAGVFYDYASDRGRVMMHRPIYERLWDDRIIQSLGIFLDPTVKSDVEREAKLVALRDQAERFQSVQISPNRRIRELALEIFDRTFLITRVLQLLAVGVAFIGVLSALMALQLERKRELGMLRANGMTPGQVWGLVSAQTGWMGLVAGLLSLPVGLAMAALLVHVINRRSFGWTLRFDISIEILLQALLLAVLAALLAGLYPAFRMSRSSPALALREE